jgi:hypothetical protein
MKGAGHQPQLEAIGKDLERLTKRHKVTHKKTEEQIDKLITDLSRCLEKMEAAQAQSGTTHLTSAPPSLLHLPRREWWCGISILLIH